MSRQIDITVQGVVGTTPTVATTPKDRVYCRFRVASTPGYRDAGGDWRNEDTVWFTAKAWGPLAENLARSLRKGDPVLLHGRLTQETWEPPNGPVQTSNVITITCGGHDLSRGVSSYMRTEPALSAPRSAATGQSDPSASSPEPMGPAAAEASAGTGPAPTEAGQDATEGTQDPWTTPMPPELDTGSDQDTAFSDAELSYELVNADA